MMASIVRTGKTVFLGILVVASIVLSYFLWSMNLQEGSEIGFTQGPSLPISNNPTLQQATRPYEIDIKSHRGNATVRVDTSAYQYWTSLLGDVHPYDVSTIKSLPSNVRNEVLYPFGIEMNRTLAGHWLTNESLVLGNWQGRAAVLYTMGSSHVWYVAFIGDEDTITAKTDLPYAAVVNRVREAVATAPVTTWNDFESQSSVPVNLTMSEPTYIVKMPQTTLLVHSFFVNPQVITRIQQDANTVLWTDGSRAVQWDSKTYLLQYEDPNSSSTAFHSDPFLSAIDFLHVHGGTQSDIIGFDQIGTLVNNPNAPVYTFTPFVDGFPILMPNDNYNVDMDNSRVLDFSRPTWELSARISSKSVHVMNQAQLLQRLKQIDPTDALASFHVELGYGVDTARLTSGQVTLVPIYDVLSSSGSEWMLNASDGKLFDGRGLA